MLWARAQLKTNNSLWSAIWILKQEGDTLLQTGCQAQRETPGRGVTLDRSLDLKQGVRVKGTTVIIVVIVIITGGPNKISSFLLMLS